MEDIEKIAGTEGIADYNITTVTTTARQVDFIRIEDEDVDQVLAYWKETPKISYRIYKTVYVCRY